MFRVVKTAECVLSSIAGECLTLHGDWGGQSST